MLFCAIKNYILRPFAHKICGVSLGFQYLREIPLPLGGMFFAQILGVQKVNAKIYILALLLSVFSFQTKAIEEPSQFQFTNSVSDLSDADFSNYLGSQVHKVSEFQFIQQEAQKLGVRAWLFGGTAAAFAHYTHWDLMRLAGDQRFQANRFDYQYFNIFRSTQDLDIVIDGTPGQVLTIENLIREKFDYMQGSRSAWEVRALRYSRGQVSDPGFKEALLRDPDFLNQNTDSHSTGMIEITSVPEGEFPVKDLRDWDSEYPVFLKDVKLGKIHFYFSNKHETTSRFRAGNNPPIFSAIRVLTKAFQFEPTLWADDLQTIKKIIEEFDPQKDLTTNFAKNWIEKNAKKLIMHAVNVEYAVNLMESLGLRQKLISISNPAEVKSMGWWLNKEPLRSFPLGNGDGKTARELGIKIVAHETSDFLAYESLTRAHTGDPNVLISRKNQPGESASFGPGFYTLNGRKGAKETGYTIRFRLNPQAKEGTDFAVAGDMILIKNKLAIKVIPHSLNLSLPNYFRTIQLDTTINKTDRGVVEKYKLILKAKKPSQLEIDETEKIVLAEIKKPVLNYTLLKEWFSIMGFNTNSRIDKGINSRLQRELELEEPNQEFLKIILHLNKAGFNMVLPLTVRMAVATQMHSNRDWGDLKVLITESKSLNPSRQDLDASAKIVIRELNKKNPNIAVLDLWEHIPGTKGNEQVARIFTEKIKSEIEKSNPNSYLIWSWLGIEDRPHAVVETILKKINDQLRSNQPEVTVLSALMDSFPSRYVFENSPAIQEIRKFVTPPKYFEIISRYHSYFRAWSPFNETLKAMIDLDKLQLTSADVQAISKIISHEIEKLLVNDHYLADAGSSSSLIHEWVKLPVSLNFPHLALKALRLPNIRGAHIFSHSFLNQSDDSIWLKDLRWIPLILGQRPPDPEKLLEKPEVINLVLSISMLYKSEEVKKIMHHPSIQNLFSTIYHNSEFDHLALSILELKERNEMPGIGWSLAIERMLRGEKREALISVAMEVRNDDILKRDAVQKIIAEEDFWLKIRGDKKKDSELQLSFGNEDEDTGSFYGTVLVNPELQLRFLEEINKPLNESNQEYWRRAIENAHITDPRVKRAFLRLRIHATGETQSWARGAYKKLFGNLPENCADLLASINQ